MKKLTKKQEINNLKEEINNLRQRYNNLTEQISPALENLKISKLTIIQLKEQCLFSNILLFGYLLLKKYQIIDISIEEFILNIMNQSYGTFVEDKLIIEDIQKVIDGEAGYFNMEQLITTYKT